MGLMNEKKQTQKVERTRPGKGEKHERQAVVGKKPLEKVRTRGKSRYMGTGSFYYGEPYKERSKGKLFYLTSGEGEKMKKFGRKSRS